GRGGDQPAPRPRRPEQPLGRPGGLEFPRRTGRPLTRGCQRPGGSRPRTELLFRLKKAQRRLSLLVYFAQKARQPVHVFPWPSKRSRAQLPANTVIVIEQCGAAMARLPAVSKLLCTERR